jgi:hypothetical protein
MGCNGGTVFVCTLLLKKPVNEPETEERHE